nr:hypothetical protein CFP56_15333 [Quercus suber]
MPPPRDEARNQVVAFEVPANTAIPIAVGGVEGSHRDTNGVVKSKEKILEQNKFRLHNLNLKDVGSGRECQIRRKMLVLRRVFWQHYRGDKQSVKWVAREVNLAQVGIKEMDTGLSEAHAPGLGSIKSCSSPLLNRPFIFEAGACSKQTQNKPSPGITGLFMEDGVLESSTSGFSSVSNGESAKVVPASSVLHSLPPRRPAMAPMVSLGSFSSISALELPGGSGSSIQVSPRCLTQSTTLPILAAEVAQAACELGSASLAPICTSLEPAESKEVSSGDLIEKLVEKSSPAVTKDEDNEFLGPEFYEDLKLKPLHQLPQPQLLPQQLVDQGFLAFQQP